MVMFCSFVLQSDISLCNTNEQNISLIKCAMVGFYCFNIGGKIAFRSVPIWVFSVAPKLTKLSRLLLTIQPRHSNVPYKITLHLRYSNLCAVVSCQWRLSPAPAPPSPPSPVVGATNSARLQPRPTAALAVSLTVTISLALLQQALLYYAAVIYIEGLVGIKDPLYLLFIIKAIQYNQCLLAIYQKSLRCVVFYTN